MAKTHKLYKINFTVEGNAAFPIDMLRFDRCCPREESDSHSVSHEDLEPSNMFAKRKVNLLMFSWSKDGPHKERWASFGWTVLDQEIIKPND